ncbi:ArnT family glycosyltransferase [Thermodesulfobacteriota bacterium]
MAETSEKENNAPNRYLIISFSVLLFVLVTSIIVLSLVPPVSRDALTHHLAIPKLYLKHGGVYEIPFLRFSYYPMNLDLLYLIPLYFGNDIVPKLIHFFFAALTAWLIYRFLGGRIGKAYGLVGALFFLSIPIIIKLSITIYVDLGLIFFSTASLFLILKWKDSGFQLKYLVASGVFCGLALGTKYNGLITFFLLNLFIPYLQSRYGKNEKSRTVNILFSTGAFFVISLLIFSPWMIRNFIWTNNPIFPLYNSFFNHVNQVQTATGHEFDPFTVRRLLFNESWWEMALLPIRIFFQGQDNSPQYFDGRLNPFLLIFSFFAFSLSKNDDSREKLDKLVLLIFSVLFFVFALFSTGVRIRYLSPIIPPIVILSIYGIRDMIRVVGNLEYRMTRKLGVLSICVMVLYSFWLNGIYIIEQFKKVAPISYLSSEITRDEYIEKYRPEYGAIKYINQNLPDNSKILLIFVGKRGYYLDRDYLAGVNIIEKVMKEAASEKEILREIRERGITHFLVRYKLFAGWVNNNMNEENKAILDKMFKNNFKLMYKEHGYGLFRMATN